MMTEFASIPTIVILCMFLAKAYKALPFNNKHIPLFCGACGLILGVLCYLLIPGWIPAENPVVAAAVGVANGLAATGVNQAYRQEVGR